MLWLHESDLPKSVNINGREYPIASDFRTWIRIDAIIQDRDIPIEMKPILAIQYSQIETREPTLATFEALLLFLNGNKPQQKTPGKRSKISENDAPAFRYDWDNDLLYAAFRQQYGINLLKEQMHWFEFRALLNGLTDQTQLVQVMRYRSVDTSKMKGEEKKAAEDLKRYYAIPEDTEGAREPAKTPQEREAELLAKLETKGD